MNLKKYAAACAIVLAFSGRAEAQSISVESLRSPTPDKSKALRFDGIYSSDDFSAFGFLDFLGDFDSFYHELYLRKNLFGKSGVQFETNGGTGYGPVFRFGYIADIPMPKGAYMNLKLLPWNVTLSLAIPEFQAGLYGHADLPEGFYVDGWADYTVGRGSKPSFLTEISAGKKIAKNISLQGQAAYNVGFKGWLSRAGFRYSF